MTTPLLLSCLWVIAAAITALLPMRAQILPGVVLAVLALPLLATLAGAHGAGAAGAGLLAAGSIFRRPLAAALRRGGA